MKTLLKFTSGLLLGAAVGAGAYLLTTKESDNDLIREIKNSVNRALEEGKRSAEERRRLLEMELGFAVDDKPGELTQ